MVELKLIAETDDAVNEIKKILAVRGCELIAQTNFVTGVDDYYITVPANASDEGKR